VFEEDAAGPMWIGVVHSIEDAQALCKSKSNYSQEKKYFVLSLKTGNRFDLSLDES
jgi:hypothetical protein